MLTPGTGPELTIQHDFNDISKAPMFVEPILRALEGMSTVLKTVELGAAAPDRREVNLMPVNGTWIEQEQLSEASTISTRYDRWIQEVEQEEPVPPLVYPAMKKNVISRKCCIFKACTVITKKLREHVDRTHIP